MARVVLGNPPMKTNRMMQYALILDFLKNGIKDEYAIKNFKISQERFNAMLRHVANGTFDKEQDIKGY